MNNSQLDGLIALKMVAEKRNFAAAANALGISPSAISQIIKQSLRKTKRPFPDSSLAARALLNEGFPGKPYVA